MFGQNSHCSHFVVFEFFNLYIQLVIIQLFSEDLYQAVICFLEGLLLILYDLVFQRIVHIRINPKELYIGMFLFQIGYKRGINIV